MSERANERIAWFNGEFMPESRVLVPFRDRSFVYGDGAFDMTRTFGHRIFRLEAHLARFYRSLKYLRIDPGLSQRELADLTMQVLERNLHLLGPDDDYWVAQRVSRGVKSMDGDNWEHRGPSVIIECSPLPLRDRATLYRDGIRVVVPSVRRIPPESLTPRAKTHNYLNMIVADHEAQAQDPGSWAILLDTSGNLCEGLGSNIFLVQDGELVTPRGKNVLAGISRDTVIELAKEAGIPFREADLDLYDAYTADEAFLTSTSLCICPITRVNGQKIGNGELFGPVTRKLTDAYIRMVDCDFVQQYLNRLG
jgi:branched-chain amino acid aminotransferase